MTDRPGVLLVNLGTPASPTVRDVRRYLREFLSDPFVIDIPALARKALLEFVILPTRPKRSADAYRSIWTEHGSPLLVHGIALRDAMRAELADEVCAVELGMRYGEPRIADALDAIAEAGAHRVIVVPLFPQYSMSAWVSAVDAVHRHLATMPGMLAVSVVPPFYDAPEFVGACAAVARDELAAFAPDRVLMSFHGLPERHIRRSDTSSGADHCLTGGDCCATIGSANRFCYRAQSYATARGIAACLELADADYEVAFQSRLGRTPWIQPYSDVRIQAMPVEGVRRLAVMCPSFTADCLETLEEIGIRAEADFVAAGGEALRLIPCVNADPSWTLGLGEIVRREFAGSACRTAVSAL